MSGGIITRGYGVNVSIETGPTSNITAFGLDKYTAITSELITAFCEADNSPTFVALNVNSKLFPMTWNSGNARFEVSLYGFQIGIVTGAPVVYLAVNLNGGSTVSGANDLTITQGALNIQENIFNNIVAALATAQLFGGALDYVQTIAIGNLEDNLTSQKPWIMVSPIRTPEEFKTMPHGRELALAIEIRGVLDCPADSPISSSNLGPGILKLDADIKNVIETDLTLNGAAWTLDIITDRYANIGGYTWETTLIVVAKKRFTTGGR